MEPGHALRVISLLSGILIAFLIAGTLTDFILLMTGLEGPAALVVSMVAFAAVFFFVLRLLETCRDPDLLIWQGVTARLRNPPRQKKKYCP